MTTVTQQLAAMPATAPAASGVDTSTNEAWAARAQEKIAAMEAASGGEDDMCPNCVTPWKCNGPHESTGGASVSERARELLAGAYRVHGHFEYADILLNKPLVGEDYIAAYAIEQALTQQRGEPVAWRFVTENRRHGPQRGHWRDVKDAGMPPQSEDLADGVTVEFAYTTPSPAQTRCGSWCCCRGDLRKERLTVARPKCTSISPTNWNPCSAKGIYQPKGKPAHNYQTYKPSPDGAMIYVQCEK